LKNLGLTESGASLTRALKGPRRKDVLGFIPPDDAPPAIGALIDPIGQLGIRLAVLAESATEPIAGFPYTP
jgi:hypothetical protein